MPTRRLIAIAIFGAAAWLAAKSRNGEFLGMLDSVVFLLALIVALVALLAGVFDIRIGKPNFEDSGFGVHEPVGLGLGQFGLLLFAIAPLFIAARGVFLGIIPVLGSDADVAFIDNPLKFLLVLSVWAGVGVGVLALWRRVSRSHQAKKTRRSGQ